MDAEQELKTLREYLDARSATLAGLSTTLDRIYRNGSHSPCMTEIVRETVELGQFFWTLRLGVKVDTAITCATNHAKHLDEIRAQRAAAKS